MRDLRRIMAFAGIAVCLSVGMKAHAVPFVFHECQDCDSVMDLLSDFGPQINYVPVGSLVLMSSKEYPISAAIEVGMGYWGTHVPIILTPDDLEGVKLDNNLYSRAAKVNPIAIPSGVSPTAQGGDSLTVGGYVTSNILIPTGPVGQDRLRGFLPWSFGQFIWVQFLDTRDGSLVEIWSNEEIDVTFADGSTAKLYLHPTNASSHWLHLRDGSQRDPNGEPYGASNPPSTGGGGNIVFVPPTDWAAAQMEAFLSDAIWLMFQAQCMVKVHMSSDDDWSWTRWVQIPCP